MSAGIFLLRQGKLIELTKRGYDSESILQELLANYPKILAGVQVNQSEPARWLLISREAQIPSEKDGGGRWAIDHLFLDHEAIPTLVEVKRSSDTRIRREVVGQLLEYAANVLSYWSIESIQEMFASNCEKEGVDPEQRLNEFLDATITAQEYWSKVKINLQAGKVRLVFVADEIPSELGCIVEFLNKQMDPAEVLAIEVSQYEGEGLKTLVPRVIGQTIEAERKKAVGVREIKQWDEATFFEELEAQNGKDAVVAAKRILEWAKPVVTRIWWGQGRRSGSFVPILNYKGQDHQLFAIYTYGSVEIYFQYYQHKKPFDSEQRRKDLAQKLNSISGVTITDDSITKRPSIKLSILCDEKAGRKFLDVFEWFIQEIKQS
jgi:hypothetical protein